MASSADAATADAATADAAAANAAAADAAAAKLKSHFQGLHDRAIFRAALEHRPFFRLSLRLSTTAGAPVYFSQDGARFGQEHTLRVVQREQYTLQLELDDLGRTVSALEAILIDEDPMKIEQSRIDFSERSNNHVFIAIGTWTPTHQRPTKDRARDVVLLEVCYSHGEEKLSLRFSLQMKVYPEGNPAKSTKGARLDAVVCRYDAAKGIERWTFAEAR